VADEDHEDHDGDEDDEWVSKVRKEPGVFPAREGGELVTSEAAARRFYERSQAKGKEPIRLEPLPDKYYVEPGLPTRLDWRLMRLAEAEPGAVLPGMFHVEGRPLLPVYRICPGPIDRAEGTDPPEDRQAWHGASRLTSALALAPIEPADSLLGGRDRRPSADNLLLRRRRATGRSACGRHRPAARAGNPGGRPAADTGRLRGPAPLESPQGEAPVRPHPPAPSRWEGEPGAY